MVLDLMLIGLGIALEPFPLIAFILILSAKKGTWKGLAFLVLRIRMKAMRGNGSRAIPSPMSIRSSTMPSPWTRSAGRHRSGSAAIRPDATAATSDLWSRSFWSA